jgi:hypothetical protein
MSSWTWLASGPTISLSDDNLKMTATASAYELATGGEPMTEGRHYWEVQLTNCTRDAFVFIGGTRPGLEAEILDRTSDDGHYIYGRNGGLFGNGRNGEYTQSRFKKGDRIGVLLDLDAGWMRFYRNGVRCGPGITSGVTGPLARSVAVLYEGDVVTVLGDAAAPEGAGDPSEGQQCELEMAEADAASAAAAAAEAAAADY